jgi:hypothetical protein
MLTAPKATSVSRARRSGNQAEARASGWAQSWRGRQHSLQNRGFLGGPEMGPREDEAEGNARAYGAARIMRLPTHLHITWQDDNTPQDHATSNANPPHPFRSAGAQRKDQFSKRRLRPWRGGGLEAPPGIEPSWQGYPPLPGSPWAAAKFRAAA